MKYIFTFSLILIFNVLMSQNRFDTKFNLLNNLPENSSIDLRDYYENISTGLVQSFVIDVKDKTQKQLVKDFKNWYSTYFVSLKTTLQSETEDQMVFNYIHVSTFKQGLLQINSIFNHDFRLVVQFRDYKMRVQFYGDISYINYSDSKDLIINSSNKYYLKGIKYQLYLNEVRHMSQILTDINNSIIKPSSDNW